MSSIRGYGITTDDQLRNLAKEMHLKLNYIGFAEQLPPKAPAGYNIINLGDKSIGGSHWVLWFVDPNMRYSIYVDSFGAPPEDEIIKIAPSPLYISDKQIQGFYEEYCGLWALLTASALNKVNDTESEKKGALYQFLKRYKSV